MMNLNKALAVLIAGLFFIAFPLESVAQENQPQDDPAPQRQRNSTRKIRVKPNELSEKAGSGVAWVADVETAFERSRETGKPVFWYVPSVRGTFMDRKPVIDMYMLAGPFSWSATRELLNKAFIPVKAVPSRELAEKYDLVPYKFVEPGFLILDGEGNELAKTDEITTLHPDWFMNRLAQALPELPRLTVTPLALRTAREQFGAGDEVIDLPAPDADAPPELVLEFLMLKGMIEFRHGYQQQASETWQAAAEQYPEQPLAWKLSCEAQGIGPFVRGFEVHTPVAEGAIADVTVEGTAAAPGFYDETAVFERGANFLLGMQRDDGGWLDSDYDFGGTDSLPNVHVAVTSLCAMSLIDCAKRFKDDDEFFVRLNDAIDRAATFVTDEKNMNRADSDEILWAVAYRVRFLSRYVKTDGLMAHPDFAQHLQAAVAELETIQSRQGGWYHEYRNPFVTGTALCALNEAKEAGATINQDAIRKGLSSLARDRYDNGAYPYGSQRGSNEADDENNEANDATREGDGQKVAASAGRMPLCELGLWYWEKSSDEELVAAIAQSLDLHEHLDRALKYDDHTNNMAYGGFFFWYDMRGRSEAINQMPASEQRDEFARRQKEIIMRLPEIDGCFVDSHELGRCYGTAMAILALGVGE